MRMRPIGRARALLMEDRRTQTRRPESHRLSEPGQPIEVRAPVSPRLPYADVLRVAATMAVVALHASAAVVLAPGSVTPAQWAVANALDAATRWAIPVFVMLSGALLLSPAKRTGPVEFARRRARRVLVPFLFWVPAYLLWGHWVHRAGISFWSVCDKLAHGRPAPHLYFLFLIIGL